MSSAQRSQAAMASLYEVLRFVHVVAAAAWFGGTLFGATRFTPTMRAAGPSAGPFVMTLLRKGGMSVYFAPAGIVTVLAGLYVYVEGGWASDPFASVASALLTIGVLLGILALAHGLATTMPTERKMKAIVAGLKGAPSPEEAARLGALGAKNGRNATIVAVMVALAFVLMAARRMFL